MDSSFCPLSVKEVSFYLTCLRILGVQSKGHYNCHSQLYVLVSSFVIYPTLVVITIIMIIYK